MNTPLHLAARILTRNNTRRSDSCRLGNYKGGWPSNRVKGLVADEAHGKMDSKKHPERPQGTTWNPRCNVFSSQDTSQTIQQRMVVL
jgi:hypothetical protein